MSYLLESLSKIITVMILGGSLGVCGGGWGVGGGMQRSTHPNT